MNLNSITSRLRAPLGGAMVLALFAASPVRADYQSTVVAQKPVGYWRLNETAQPPVPPINATNIGSVGSTAGDGVYYYALRGVTPGAIVSEPANGAVQFTASTDGNRVRIPYQPQWNTSYPFSVEFWERPDRTNALQCVAANIEFISSPTAQRNGWLIYQGDSGLNNGQGWVFRLYNSTGLANQTGVNWGGQVNPNAWYHIVGTFDGTNIKLYINGSLAASAAIAGTFRQNTNSAIPLTFGSRADGASGYYASAATFDEAAYYTTALSDAQVLAHYQAGTNALPPTPYKQVILNDSPVGYWRFNEPPDARMANLGTLGSAATAVCEVGTTPGSQGPRPAAYPGFEAANYAVSLPGTGPCVDVPALNLNTNTVTISGWIKPSTLPQSPLGGMVLCHSGTTYAGLITDLYGTGVGYIWNNDISTYNWSPSANAGLPTPPASDWSYVALVVRPDQAGVYLCASNNPANFAGVTNIFAHVNQAFGGATLIGSDTNSPSLSFGGDIDEVAVWNRALGVGELYSQYAAAVGGLGPKVFADTTAVPSTDVYSGDSFTVSVDVGGTPDLHYQWSKSTGAILGATNSSYTIANPQTSDTDTYSCQVTNLYGTFTSSGLLVTVHQALPPTIDTPPMGRTLYPGATLNLSVVAEGGGLRYQWKKNGTNIAGATISAYQILSVATNDTGSYSVLITNGAPGSITAGPALVTVLAPANDYEAAIVADKPEAWFRLNETSGTNMFDSMGRHDGTYTNEDGSSVTLGVPGAIAGSSDKAVSFDGTSRNYGIIPYSEKLNGISPNTFTVEAWVKTSNLTSTRAAVSSRSASPLQGWYISTYPVGNWGVEYQLNDGNYYAPITTASDAIVVDKWTHVALLCYGGGIEVFVDGLWDGKAWTAPDRNASAPFIIGGRGGSPLDELWNGQVDEVVVYTNALSATQIQNHYSKGAFAGAVSPYFTLLPSSQEVVSNDSASLTLTGVADGPVPLGYQWYKNGSAVSGATTTALTLTTVYSNAGSYVLRATNNYGFTNSAPATVSILPPTPAYVNVTNGLVLHLKFDGNYQDSSGRGNNGTQVGSPTFVAGRFGNALFFSTDTSVPAYNYVTLGKPVDLNFSSNVNFSVSYWVKYDAGQLNGDLPFLCSANNSYGNSGFTFAPTYNKGGWSYSLNGAVQIYGADSSINDGNWHHLLHIFDRTGSGYAVTYLDGVQADSRPCTSAGNLDTGNTVNIGQDPTGTYAETGSTAVDDMAVWRRALTSYEAYAVYYAATNSNASFDVPGTVTLHIATSGTNLVLSWNPGSTLGTLLEATNVTGPWTSAGAYAPVYTVTPGAAKKFYRLSLSE